MLRLVPTTTHGLIDYLSGLLLIVIPFLLEETGSLGIPLMAIGAVIIGYSAATDYEFGAWPAIRLPIHLVLDSIVGMTLMALALVFRPAEALLPLLTLGTIFVILAVTTEVETTAISDLQRLSGQFGLGPCASPDDSWRVNPNGCQAQSGRR